jgi:hypothetical protein
MLFKRSLGISLELPEHLAIDVIQL